MVKSAHARSARVYGADTRDINPAPPSMSRPGSKNGKKYEPGGGGGGGRGGESVEDEMRRRVGRANIVGDGVVGGSMRVYVQISFSLTRVCERES